MFFNKKITLVLLVLGVMLVAGCTQGGTPTTTTGNGLEITDFSSDQTEVYSDSNVRVTASIENQGETTVRQGGGLLLIGADEWGPTDKMLVRSFSKSLRPADPVRGIPADMQIETWTLKAPTLPRGQTKPFTFTGRVYYDYNTTALGTIFIYPPSEATAARERGETLESSNFVTTKGPVAMTVRVAPDPPVIEMAGETFTIEVTFDNVGGGVSYNYGSVTGVADGNDVSRFSISETNLNVLNLQITGLDGSKNLKISSSECYQNIQMVGGRTSIICDVEVLNPPSVKTGYAVSFNAGYGYYSEQQVSISAIGKN